MQPLVDGLGRELKSLRVSVTDSCNFRCTYCMPEEGLEWLGRDAILSYEEIERLVAHLRRMGMDEVRLTGGEPLVRRDLPAPDREARARSRALTSLSLTTNGVRARATSAKPLVEPGCAASTSASIRRCARSSRTSRAATRSRRSSRASRSARSIRSCARSRSTPSPSGASARTRCLAFAELARRKPYIVRWIEFMPLDADGHWDRRPTS